MRDSIRIVSDGTGIGTLVFSASGEPLKNVVGIQIHPIVRGELVRATIDFVGVDFDVVAKQEDAK